MGPWIKRQVSNTSALVERNTRVPVKAFGFFAGRLTAADRTMPGGMLLRCAPAGQEWWLPCWWQSRSRPCVRVDIGSGLTGPDRDADRDPHRQSHGQPHPRRAARHHRPGHPAHRGGRVRGAGAPSARQRHKDRLPPVRDRTRLVMVLGYAAAMSLWTVDLLSGLARHFRVTIFDNRGVGYTTDNLSQPITVPLMAQDTVGLIQVLGQRSPILLGWSMGGEIGLTVAALHPGVLAKLVTSGANPGSSQSVQPSPEVIHELNDPATTPEQFLDLLFPPTAEAAKARFSQQYLLVPQEKVSALTIKRQGAAGPGSPKTAAPGTPSPASPSPFSSRMAPRT